ncbi:MAG: choice-of-anchor D domain-containing protein, partial [Caldisericia bacterium]|nr:choice-of-anchor D domain-containing protein [Caldisericia bacterium]
KEKVKLVFIHHSTGEDWLNLGDLRKELNKNNYYVVETNYEWGPEDLDVNDGNPIGYHTDPGYWYNWFLGPNRDIYLSALYKSSYTTGENSFSDPGGEAQIVMFKSCFTSLQVIYGNKDDPPLKKGEKNPIYGKGCMDDWAYTISNIKGLYRDLLDYFKTRQDKLFIIITTPPSLEGNVDKELASLLRGINSYLVYDLLKDYPYNNVFIFDYYNVLTSNGGSHFKNDLNSLTGNHHRYRDGEIEHTINFKNDFLAYGSDTDGNGTPDDNHPNSEGHKKATYEFTPLLNIAYNKWKSGGVYTTPKTSIDYKPKNLDFGKVEVNKISNSKQVYIKNTGDLDIKINDLQITGKNSDEFLIINNFCKDKTLKKGDECGFEVVFKPKSEGLKEGKLIKESEPKIEISLYGQGYIASTTPTQETGNVYYVSNSGNDNNLGTKEKPWKTVGFASKKLKPGDTLIILNGEYIISEYYEDMITPTSGLENKWITIKGEEGFKPKIKGKNGLLAAIDISGKNFIRIENLEISSLIDSPYSGGLREGIEAGGSSSPNEGKVSKIILKDIIIHNVEEVGINFAGNIKNIQIENIHIHHTGGPSISAPSAEGGRGWENVVISNSIV